MKIIELAASRRAALLFSAAVLVPAPVFAQDDSSQEDTDETENSIVVTATPIRDSLEAALREKREAVNVVDVIAADTIGRLPDQNLADTLQRIPGLAVERDQGQARFVNFRGAPFRFTSIAFNGIDVPGAEDGRVPRFDSFPAVITSGIAVNKAILANMPGESVSGFINIKTASPFDRYGFSISAEGGLGRQELGDQQTERLNGRISYSNDTFGVLAFGSRNLRGRITDNREYELTPGPNGTIFPDNLDFRSYRGEREDRAFGGEIGIRPSDGVNIYARTIFSEFIDREERNQFDFDIRDGADITGTPFTSDTGYQPLVLVTRLLEDGVYTNSTWVSTLGADIESDDWTISGTASYIETANDVLLPIPFSAGGTAALQYDVTDIFNPQVQLFEPFTMNPIAADDIQDYGANFGLVFANALDTENYKFQLSFARDGLDFLGGDTTIRFGGQIDFRQAEGGDTLVFGGFPESVNIPSFLTDNLWSSNFDNTIQARDFDNQGLIDAWENAVGGFDVTFDDDSLISIDENIYAAYASVETVFDGGSAVLGARFEATDFETTGSQVGPDGGLTPLSVENDYVHFLPNAHLNFDLTDELKFRISVSTGVSRPTYSQLRASIAVDVTEVPPIASGGNPRLDAETSYGGDVSLEYYFAPGGIISAGAFYRFIDNVLYNAGDTVPDGSVVAPGLIAPGTPLVYNTTFNGEDGYLAGLELNLIGTATFLPEPLDGFGISANLTLLESGFDAPNLNQRFDLPGTSDTIFNLSVFWEKFGFSIRGNYTYRSPWLSTTENEALNEFWNTTERVDLSFRYQFPTFNNGVTLGVFADANNVTDVRDLRFTNTIATPNQFEGFGARYMFGLRVDY